MGERRVAADHADGCDAGSDPHCAAGQRRRWDSARCGAFWASPGLTSIAARRGLARLRGYKKSKFGTPVHDDASHGADAMKTVATGLNLVTALSSSPEFRRASQAADSGVGMKDRTSLNEAVKYLMKTTGRTRRQAEQRLLQALKSGELKATGVRAGMSIPEEIPAEVFRSIPAEH